MKNILITSLAILLLSMFIYCQTNKNNTPILKGPYFGEKLTDKSEQLFLPSIFGESHSSPTFSPGGDQVFWSVGMAIHSMDLINGVWTSPRKEKFLEKSFYEDVPFFSVDGKRLYFYAACKDTKYQTGIWYMDKINNKWTSPKPVGSKINSIYGHWQFSVSTKGTIYFPGRDPGNEVDYIMVSRWVNGEYEKPVKVFKSIPGRCPYIAPDESYLIFSSEFESGDLSKLNLYICFRKKDGSWSDFINLSKKMEIPYHGQLCPIVSPNGKYLFHLNHSVYWNSAKIIDELRPKE